MFFQYIDPGTGVTIFSFGGWLIGIFVVCFGIFSIFLKKILYFIKQHRILISILCFLIFTLILWFVMNKEIILYDKKVIILGFDGLSPQIIEKMMQKNLLPNFSKLKKQGTYSSLRTTIPSQSPIAWAGFATGKNPGKHGIYSFIQRNPLTYSLDISLTNFKYGKPQRVLNQKTLWEYTSSYNIPNVIITPPVSFPPPKIFGKILSGMGVPDLLGTQGTFTFYTSESNKNNQKSQGNIFYIKKRKLMFLKIIGPKVSSLKQYNKNITIPFQVEMIDNQNVKIKYQQKEFILEKGKWSDWKEVIFKVSWLKKISGTFKFLLIDTEPEFKLYISPINYNPKNPLFNISYPSKYSKTLAENIGFFYTQGMPMATWPVNENILSQDLFIEQVNDVLAEKTAMYRLELNKLENGLLFCYFESPDIIQHMFWNYIDPQHPLYEKNSKYKNMIYDWYKKMDDILGMTLKKITKEDTIIVLSDHGFTTFRKVVHINSWLRKNGYLKLLNPYARKGKELLMDIDWSQTKAYAVGFGSIYINQKGREKFGIVNPGEESLQLKKQLAQELAEWKDNDKKVVNTIYYGSKIFKNGKTSDMPDLFIGLNRGYRASWQTALGAVAEKLIEDNLKKWSGTHLCDPALVPGILFCNHKLNLTERLPSLYDITPTVLKKMGITKEDIKKADFDGMPLLD